MKHSWIQSLNRGVDGSSLALIRILFGALMVLEFFRYWGSGWIHDYFIKPDFFFKYYNFEWVTPWAGEGMYIHFAVFGLCGLLVLLGLFYRLAIWGLFLSFSYIFLLDQARYLNHFYLVILVAFVLALVPAHRTWSLDAWFSRKTVDANAGQVPWWSILFVRYHLEIVLLFAGIVKINPDWLNLMPLSIWMSAKTDLPIIGPIMDEPWAHVLGSYGSIILHIVGAPLLFFKRTRLAVFCVYTIFHLSNSVVFNIGIFPWMTIALTTIFFEPDWPKTLWNRICGWFSKTNMRAIQSNCDGMFKYTSGTKITWCMAGVFLVIQAVFPLRHLLYPGSPSWTEEGHRFSWQMMLRTKQASVVYYIKDPLSGERWTVNPKQFLTPRQSRKMPSRPDMILQFAHYLGEKWRLERGVQTPQVFVKSYVGLNGRRPQLFIDPRRDLMTVKREMWPPADWILPMKNTPYLR